jgi:hypothetical protein
LAPHKDRRKAAWHTRAPDKNQAGRSVAGDAAEYLLSLQFDERDISRMNELSEIARRGSLSGTEASELDSYIHVSNLPAVIRSKAMQSLHAREE